MEYEVSRFKGLGFRDGLEYEVSRFRVVTL